MDVAKIGLFIKQLRTEKGLTQKQLADMLYITDRAVSKWERGLSAPDISLLEPLAEIFDVSVSEIIAGERNPQKDEKTDIIAREVLFYSYHEIKTRIQKRQKKIYIKFAAIFVSIVFLFMCAVQIAGDGFGIDCIPAYLHLNKATNAVEHYNQKQIEKTIYRARDKDVYNKLIYLREKGVEIIDRDADLSRTRLDDGFMFTRAEIVVRYNDIDYMLYLQGTYRNGKTELMYIENANYDRSLWIDELERALCTYNPG